MQRGAILFRGSQSSIDSCVRLAALHMRISMADQVRVFLFTWLDLNWQEQANVRFQNSRPWKVDLVIVHSERTPTHKPIPPVCVRIDRAPHNQWSRTQPSTASHISGNFHSGMPHSLSMRSSSSSMPSPGPSRLPFRTMLPSVITNGFLM